MPGDAFAAAMFNPTGDEPCIAVVVSGAEIAEFHETAVADVADMLDVMAEQHDRLSRT